MLKADLHVHTHYSKDSTSSLDDIIQHCMRNGINCIAVTDHNSIEGAVTLQRSAPFKIIIGEEVMTSDGEIIGLFLQEKVPDLLTPEETIAHIKAQGGLVCIPHPFDRFRAHSRLHTRSLKNIEHMIDLIEVFNSRTLALRDSTRAYNYAEKLRLPGTVGSDAHVVHEIGRSYIEMSDFDNSDQFKQVLVQGKHICQRTSIFIHFYNIRNRLIKLVRSK